MLRVFHNTVYIFVLYMFRADMDEQSVKKRRKRGRKTARSLFLRKFIRRFLR